MSSNGKVRVGIIGMGIGKSNARGIAANPRGEVAALCDLDIDRMKGFAPELPGEPKLYTDYTEMCRDPDLDAIFVGTPNQLHVSMAMEAIKRDKHVLVTKPLADSEDAARELVDAAEKSGVVNMMSLNQRYSPLAQYFQDKAADGFFGELYYGRTRSIRRNGIPSWNLGFIKEGGGAFRDMGVHVLDLAWTVMGQPRPVSVTGVAGAKFGPRGLGYSRETPEDVWRQYEADDYGAAFIRFENGAGLLAESFWASHQPPGIQMELFGTEGGAQLHPPVLFWNEDGTEKDEKVEVEHRGQQAWENVASHFIECILDGVQCRSPLRNGLQVQQMMEATLVSARTGREVVIENYR